MGVFGAGPDPWRGSEWQPACHGAWGVDSIIQGAARTGSAFAHIQQSIWNAHSPGAGGIAHPDDGETNEDGTPNERASVRAWTWSKSGTRPAMSRRRSTTARCAGMPGSVLASRRQRQPFPRVLGPPGPGFPTTTSGEGGERARRARRPAGRADQPVVQRQWSLHRPEHSISASGRSVAMRSLRNGGAAAISFRVQQAKGMQVMLYRSPGRSVAPSAASRRQVTMRRSRRDQPATARTGIASRCAGRFPNLGRPATAATEPVIELKAIASPIFLSPSLAEASPELPIPRTRAKTMER